MIITDLETHLLPALTDAEEVWIAVALMTDQGYRKIKSFLTNTIQHYLIGIDLPTPPSVLRDIQGQIGADLEAKLAYYTQTFHAKVYIIKKSGHWTAFVGSANLTDPGLRGNHEISYLITDPAHCRDLVRWFNDLYHQAYPLTPGNINKYELHYTPGDETTGNGRPRRPPLQFSRPSNDEQFFDNKDLTGYFFGKDDYLAFQHSRQEDWSPTADRDRERARRTFLDLHEIIFPQFNTWGLSQLHHHGREENIVSLPSHRPGYTNNRLNAMWLSYGKSDEEIKRYQADHKTTHYTRVQEDDRDRQTFINHARLQVRIEVHQLDISLLFAKDFGGEYDRDHFKTQMGDPGYRQEFFDKLRQLPPPYWIRVNDKEEKIASFTNPDQLRKHTRGDRPEHYFIIGRRYNVLDPALLRSQLPTTVLQEFHRLYPLYEFMRHRNP